MSRGSNSPFIGGLKGWEMELVRMIRRSPLRGYKGGRSVSRKGLWIRGHLLEVGKDYPYSMYKGWKRFIETAELKIRPGSYQNFINYLYVLRRLGLIIREGEGGGFKRTYYRLNPEKVNSRIWLNPYNHYSRMIKAEKGNP